MIRQCSGCGAVYERFEDYLEATRPTGAVHCTHCGKVLYDPARTFKRSESNPDRCANCGQRELLHKWICDCGRERTRDPRDPLLPLAHVTWNKEDHAHAGATLECDVEALS